MALAVRSAFFSFFGFSCDSIKTFFYCAFLLLWFVSETNFLASVRL
jgi:hypothetical protein